MADNPRGATLGRRLAHWWWVLPLAYLVISIVYQAFFFPFLPGGTERYHLETDCYIVEIRFPLVLTVANQPGGEVSQPASFWVWKNTNQTTAVCDSEARIAITHDTLDLVWLEEKQEVPASRLLPVSNRREEAMPHRAFVYLAPQENLPPKAELSVLVNQTQVDKIQGLDGSNLTAIPVRLWSAGKSGWFRLANLLLGSQNLAVVTGAITLLTALYKFFQDAQMRRAQQQKDFETALQSFDRLLQTKPERIAEEYFALHEKTQDWNLPQEQREQLERKFKTHAQGLSQGRIWAHSLREEIIRRIKEKRTDEHKLWLAKVQTITSFPKSEEYEALLAFWESADKTPSNTEFPMLLKNGLSVFRALGMESADWVVERVYESIHQHRKASTGTEDGNPPTTEPNTNASNAKILEGLKTEWFSAGKAAGHYLLEKLAQHEQSKLEEQKIPGKIKISGIRSAIQKWEGDTPIPPNQIEPPFGLWGRDPVYETSPRVLELWGGASPRWRHPFGPLKAEDDPRLPLKAGEKDKRPVGGLFWDEHPLWKQVSGDESCLITAPAGRGGSAMMLMGRHIRRLWGRAPGLSLGLTLSGKPDAALLWQQAERALSETLRRDLVEDPYWLLSAPPFVREWVVSFFQKEYEQVSRLSRRLQEAGLPKEDSDVVISVLHMAIGRNAYRGAGQFPELLLMLRQVLGEAARYRLRSGKFDIFYWIELPDPRYAAGWLETLQETGLPNLGAQKIFCRSSLASQGWNEMYRPFELTWSEEDLGNMLNHRLKQCNQTEIKDSLKIEHLVKEAKGSPSQLIALGNEAVQKLASQEQGA
jgi:hypothetical protein